MTHAPLAADERDSASAAEGAAARGGREDAAAAPAGGGRDRDPEDLVPTWLAVLVLLLLLAVTGVGGYVLRGVLSGPEPRSAEELEIARLTEQVEASPRDPRALLALAFAYQQAGRYDEALGRYSEVLLVSPHDTAANYNRGMIYLELELPDKAEEALWDVLEVEPDHALAAKALGEYYASRKQYRSLVEAVRPAVEAKPQMADLQYLMGLAYENLGRPDWAAARYELALKYVPDMKKAREGLRRLEGDE